jgi:hypothetical protein
MAGTAARHAAREAGQMSIAHVRGEDTPLFGKAAD